MQSVWAVVFALLAAAANATATVLQRKAAGTVPISAGFRLRLIVELLHRPVWLAGFGAIVLAAVFQALALSEGALALVQPLFVLELPMAMLIAGFVLGRRLTRGSWLAVLSVVGGLGVALAAADPQGGITDPPGGRWAVATGCCVGAVALLVVVARRHPPGRLRAASLAAGAAIGYALTAALLKAATYAWQRGGIVGFFEAWQTYGFALAGVGAVFLLENAMQSGPLVASQPALTLTDALVSLALGVTVFEETLRTGWWLLPEIAGVLAILAGAVVLARTPLARLLAEG
ncbi:DMT family transporter [Kitasatospora sp. NBC_00240]|uniref:DMT family transporter n=1 Tax=Kitasatospora sp. NBC_00240 TaxID=2903567 RepID=UPI0022505672|nr:DMT family transporter [Kitasatospora sp. NBC_00240]MCX5213613.1 DMT family transporter [Kitasatospora sp. NBC_00240]